VVRVSLAVAVAQAACATIAPYNQTEYESATSLKVESLAMMARMSSPYADHRVEAEALQMQLDKAYEYAKGLPHNEISAQQWAILRNPDGHMVGGMLRRWQAEGQLSQTFVSEMIGQVSKGFDELIALESQKLKD
jgi:hypothetical protein